MERIVFIDWNDRSLAPTAAMRVQYWADKLGVHELDVTSRGLVMGINRGGLKSRMRRAFALLNWSTPSQVDSLTAYAPQIMNRDNINPTDRLLGFNWAQIDEAKHRVAELGHPSLVDRIHLFSEFATGQSEEIQDPNDLPWDIGDFFWDVRDFIADRIHRESSRRRVIKQIQELLGDDPTNRLRSEEDSHELRKLARYISATHRIDNFSKLLVRKLKVQ